MAEPHVLRVLELPRRDLRLGRHVLHDERSRRYAVAPRDPRKLRSVRHRFHIPVLDQGSLGSCTGNAAVHVLGSDAFWRSLPSPSPLSANNEQNQSLAVAIYSDATRLDPWPGVWEPEDTGSNGLSVAKALVARGLISGYRHAFSLEAALAALEEAPVMVGTTWHARMMLPDPNGRLRPVGEPYGGHEYVLDELDVAERRVWVRNSWGEGWGRGGRAWLAWADLEALLADNGDVTVLVPRTEPAPEPAPLPPLSGRDAKLDVALQKLLDNETAPKYLREAYELWRRAGA